MFVETNDERRHKLHTFALLCFGCANGMCCCTLLCFGCAGLSSDSLHLGGRLVYVPVGLLMLYRREWEASSGKWKKHRAHPRRYVMICTLLCLGYAGLGCLINCASGTSVGTSVGTTL